MRVGHAPTIVRLRLALISDIHANLPALEAVLSEIEGAGVDELWCLGDVVGYGAQPDECAALVAERCGLCLVGNHDLAVLGELDVSSFSPAAAAAVELDARGGEAGDARVPARPRAGRREPRGGAVSRFAARPRLGVRAVARPGRRVHRHPGRAGERRRALPRGAVLRHARATSNPAAGGEPAELLDAARGAQAGGGTRLDLSEGRWLVNPGSVGQPRDGDPRAAWLELDTESWEATYHRVDYEIDRAAEAIEATDLPEHLARRLYVGQ